MSERLRERIVFKVAGGASSDAPSIRPTRRTTPTSESTPSSTASSPSGMSDISFVAIGSSNSGSLATSRTHRRRLSQGDDDIEVGTPSDREKIRLVETDGIVSLKENGSFSDNKVPNNNNIDNHSTKLSNMGYMVLLLLIFQTCSKNLLTRYVMRDRPKILTAAAIIGVESCKIVFCTLYIVLVEKRCLSSIIQYVLVDDHYHTKLLIFPACAYSLQMSQEYIALSELDPAFFTVIIQSRMLITAVLAGVILKKKLSAQQIVSLLLLTTGVILCNYESMVKDRSHQDGLQESSVRGVVATLVVALCSSFASVFTEKVIKAPRKEYLGNTATTSAAVATSHSLAYTQVQLALVSLIINGTYVLCMEYTTVAQQGLWHGFSGLAFVNIVNTAFSGLVTASTLKYADSILKGYATAIAMLLIALLSFRLFGTHLGTLYGIGVVNVCCSVFLYSIRDLDRLFLF